MLVSGELFARSKLAHSGLQMWASRTAGAKILSTLAAGGLRDPVHHFHQATDEVIAQTA